MGLLLDVNVEAVVQIPGRGARGEEEVAAGSDPIYPSRRRRPAT